MNQSLQVIGVSIHSSLPNFPIKAQTKTKKTNKVKFISRID